MSDEQDQEERERRRLEDDATFGLDQDVKPGEAAAEVTTTSNNKLILIGLIAGAISILLVACITAGFIGMAMMNRKADPVAPADKQQALTPAEEAKGKIKRIDRETRTIHFLMSNDIKKPYQVTDQTDFYDRDGRRLEGGFNDPALREEDYCIIQPTDDHKALRWLKQIPRPK